MNWKEKFKKEFAFPLYEEDVIGSPERNKDIISFIEKTLQAEREKWEKEQKKNMTKKISKKCFQAIIEKLEYSPINEDGEISPILLPPNSIELTNKINEIIDHINTQEFNAQKYVNNLGHRKIIKKPLSPLEQARLSKRNVT